MGTSNDLFILVCAIFCVSVTCLAPNATTEGKDEAISNQDLVRDCDTPNHKRGICIDIRQCAILLKQLSKKEAWDFLRASICKQPSINDFYPKVCCGKDDNFKNDSKITGIDILPKNCGYQNYSTGRRIFGGKEALIGEYPWMVLLLHTNKYGQNVLGCAGFLIHPKYAITAAHCTHPVSINEKRGPITSVLLGEHDIKTTTDCSENMCVKNTQSRRIDKVITHPGYDPYNTGRYNDIAIIKFKKNVRETVYVKPICLLEDDTQIPINYVVSGWGKTENASHSKVKLFVELPPFDKSSCIEKYTTYRIYLNESQVCAGGEELADSCTGDSGGPLMMQKDNDTWYAAGVVSFGVGCGTRGLPGVYTNIAKFLPWIKSQMVE
ncbi:serine protease 7-like [Anoplophora glabripennis]|uniref:serine protease 7-like n=1 Tax=Anoplophora glabripennis TaxID=217634 RepID=UPI0008745671|nr:serine protease 7-like [Anoplophora glabripennis]